MANVNVSREEDAVVVDSGYWRVRHRLSAGGAWDLVRFHNGSRKNLLAGLANTRYRILDPHPRSDASSMLFYEQAHEKNPAVDIQELPTGDVAITFAGEFRDASGASLGTRYRQRFEYRRWGLIACELEVDFTQERADVVELKAVEIPLRPGLSHAYVRKHPIEGHHSDLLGLGIWVELDRERYISRYVPVHMVAFEKGVEGIEFFPATNLDTWDKSLNPERGMGLYLVTGGTDTPGLIELDPYCVAYRRNPTRLRGKYTFRYYLGLPFIKDAQTVHSKYFHMATGSRWAPDDQIRQLGQLGVKLIRFHNDYREDGPFWHDGMYPPYDPEGMKELRRVVQTGHEAGMMCVPYISLKEFHPESPGFRENQRAWQREAGPTFRELHTWVGSGEFGQLMCLESGWLQRRKNDIDTILNDIPWDGLYFDWCTPHPCRHPDHLPGVEYHTDADAYVDFMFWCRDRVGENGIIFSHLSGLPYIFVENMSDLVFIYEDIGGKVPDPDHFPIQCSFIPITPRHLVGAPHDPIEARKFIVGGILQGHPPSAFVPMHGFTLHLVEEMKKFAGIDFAQYRFLPASRRPIDTGRPGVYASLWYRRGDAVIYVANLTDKPARGTLRLDAETIRPPTRTLVIRKLGPSAKPSAASLKATRPGKTTGSLTVRRLDTKAKPTTVSVSVLKSKGITYTLPAWGTAAYRLEG